MLVWMSADPLKVEMITQVLCHLLTGLHLAKTCTTPWFSLQASWGFAEYWHPLIAVSFCSICPTYFTVLILHLMIHVRDVAQCSHCCVHSHKVSSRSCLDPL